MGGLSHFHSSTQRPKQHKMWPTGMQRRKRSRSTTSRREKKGEHEKDKLSRTTGQEGRRILQGVPKEPSRVWSRENSEFDEEWRAGHGTTSSASARQNKSTASASILWYHHLVIIVRGNFVTTKKF